MLYFSFYEIFIGCIGFSILGFSFGLLMPAFYDLISFPKGFILLLKNILKENSIKNLKSAIKYKAEYQKHKSSHLADFLFVSIFFVFITLFTYSYFDGIIRIFPIVFSIVFLSFSSRKIAPKVYKILSKIIYPIRISAIYVAYIFFIPIKFLICVFKKLFLLIFNPIKEITAKNASVRIKNRKMNELKNMLNVKTA